MEDKELQENVTKQRKYVFESYEELKKILEIHKLTSEQINELEFWLRQADKILDTLSQTNDIETVTRLERAMNEAHEQILFFTNKLYDETNQEHREIKRILSNQKDAKRKNIKLSGKTQEKLKLTLKKDGSVERNLKI